MKVLLLTEGGGAMGLGHLARCSALAAELVRRGLAVQLLSQGPVADLELEPDLEVSYCPWQEPRFFQREVLPLVDRGHFYCIVDSYLAGAKLYRLLAAKAKICLYLDDTGRLDYPRGIIVNGALAAGTVAYPAGAGRHYLLGPRYAILRRPFAQAPRSFVREQVAAVLVTMGGSHVGNLLARILEWLVNSYPQLAVQVVCGGPADSLEEIARHRREKVQLYRRVDAAAMKELMLKADLAITAAGQTVYELMATGTPFIPIQVAGNQWLNLAGLAKHQLIDSKLDCQDAQLIPKLARQFRHLLPFEKRRSLVDSYRKLVDGQGCRRVIDYFLELE